MLSEGRRPCRPASRTAAHVPRKRMPPPERGHEGSASAASISRGFRACRRDRRRSPRPRTPRSGPLSRPRPPPRPGRPRSPKGRARTRCGGCGSAPPVPAGISRPTITFSFSPTSLSRLPCTEASVSTRVVSWNDAAEMKLRVCRLALVMPSRIGSPLRRARPFGDRLVVDLVELGLVDVLALQQRGIARIEDLHFWSIWRTITSMCLSLIFTPCRR
jgi:hypothetical protein